MKKVSLMLGALALVLGLSQCNKEKSPVQAGEKQYIEVTASNGNDGSKVNVDFASVPTVMNLTWEEGDVITVSGGAVGTLTLDEGAGTAQGHFSGEIKKMNDNELVFSYKKAAQERGDENPNLPDFSAQDGTQAWIKDNLYLETKAAYNDNGKYSLLMEMPYAVLKLDLSALVDTQNDVTIKVGDDIVATVNNLAAANAGLVYVAVPTDGTEQAYTFSGNGRTVEKTWELAASTYYTAEGGNAIVITAPSKFSVAEGVTVEFAPGNLWYGKADGESTAAFHFEANQWSTTPASDGTWDPSHVSHFYWSKDAAEAIKEEFNWGQSMSTYDEFFTEASDFQVSGYEANTWRTLSRAEWNYLLGYDPEQCEQTDSYGRPGAKGLCAWKELDEGTHKGLVILPDGTDALVMESITSTEALATHGAVFLPAAGDRYGTDVERVGSCSYYWSGTNTNYEFFDGNSYYMYFDSGDVGVNFGIRGLGSAVRLVR